MNLFKKIKFSLSAVDILFCLVLLSILIARIFIFEPIQVNGSSMNPTLHNGERMIEIKQRKFERFDIVTLDAPDVDDEVYIKRIIGLPGETIAYKNGKLYVDGKVQEEKYLDDYTARLMDGQPLTLSAVGETSFQFEKIPDGKYLVLGDNRRNSKDSRFFGFVEEKKIRGKVIFKLFG